MTKSPRIPALVLVTTGFLFAASSIFAIGSPNFPPNQPPSGPPASLPPTASQAGQSPAHANIRACQARENAIKQRSLRLTQLATTMEARFDTIASRVENYYTNTVVPSGKTVPNYSSLVTAVQSAREAIQTALTQAQTDATNFSCTSNDPKDQLTQFRLDMQAVIRALKNYRTSIKNLIVAVHSVVGTTNSGGEASGSGQGRGGNQ